jgi:hypothetical protein
VAVVGVTPAQMGMQSAGQGGVVGLRVPKTLFARVTAIPAAERAA